MNPVPAMLLLGPTGSGKTPLGQELERRGLCGGRCLHFDFGENLRQAVTRDRPDEILSRADLDFLRDVLASGALLEDRDFPVAERILRSFLDRHRADEPTLVVLNGLPRHVGQARDLSRTVAVRTVVVLACSPQTVLSRISANTGGDRSQRTDDRLADVRRKLAIYAQRTAPLVDFYEQGGARRVEILVGAEMTAEQMRQALDEAAAG